MHPFLILNAYKINFECIQFGVRWVQFGVKVESGGCMVIDWECVRKGTNCINLLRG